MSSILILCPGLQDPVVPVQPSLDLKRDWIAYFESYLESAPKVEELLARARRFVDTSLLAEFAPIYKQLRADKELKREELARWIEGLIGQEQTGKSGLTLPGPLLTALRMFKEHSAEKHGIAEIWLLHDGSEMMQIRARLCAELATSVYPGIGRLDVKAIPVMIEEIGENGEADLRALRVHDFVECLREIPRCIRDFAERELSGREAVFLIAPGTPQMNLGLLEAARTWDCPHACYQALNPAHYGEGTRLLLEIDTSKLEFLGRSTASAQQESEKQRKENRDLRVQLAELQEATTNASYELLGLDDWIGVPDRQVGWPQLSRDQQEMLVRQAIARFTTNRKAATQLGVSHVAVGKVRKRLGI